MPRFTGRWTANVNQDFDIEAETEEEARGILSREMSPRNVVELMDFEVHDWEEVADGA